MREGHLFGLHLVWVVGVFIRTVVATQKTFCTGYPPDFWVGDPDYNCNVYYQCNAGSPDGDDVIKTCGSGGGSRFFRPNSLVNGTCVFDDTFDCECANVMPCLM